MSRKHLALMALSFLAVLSATAQAATAAPTSLVATPASSSSITLTWVSNSSGSGFVVQRSLDNRHYAVVGTTAANITTFTDSGLAQNQLYLYRVKATSSQGDSAYSNWNFAVTRASVLSTVMPSDPAAVWKPGGGAMLSWSDTFDGETGFKIERSDNAGAFTQIAVTGPGATSYTDTAVLADTTYTYRIRATSAPADSAYSRTAQVNHYGVYSGDLFRGQGGLSYSSLLAPPTNLSASAISTSQINLTWQDNSNNETGFAVLRSFDNVHFTLLGTTAANVTTLSDSTVIFGVTYYYRVVATGMTSAQIFSALDSSAVASAQSRAFNAQLPAPSILTFAAIPGGGVALTWQDNSTNESGFAIERGDTPFQFSRIATVGPNVTSFTDPSGGNNYYRVQALNPSGDSVYSPPAGPIDTYYLLRPPPATPTLTAATVSATRVNLNWSPANMWPVRVERSVDGVNFSAAGMAGGNQNTFQDCSAPPGTLCSYRIQLTHYTTNPYSNVATAATPGLSAPAAPTGVSATGVSPTQINVKWAAVDVSVTSTTVERSTNGGATFAVRATLPPSNLSFSDAGLPAGTTASYRLRVINPVGTSGYSNTATAGTLGAYPAVTVTSKALGQHTRLTVQGTPANDTILVSQVGNTILVSVNGGAATSYAGPFGELVVKGGGGDDNITVDSSVSVEQVLVYGDGGKGNNVLNALGSGKQTIVAVGGGCDICTGNGINTSYWVDEAGVDTVNASPAEIAALRVHRIKQFCQPYSFDPTNSNFVSKVLDGQTWPEPFSYTFNFGWYLQRYPENSLWGRSPVMFDINASYFFSCGYMAPFQSRVDKHPDVVQEIMADLGDGTYAAQVGEPEDQAYARVDGYVAPGQLAVLGPSGDQWYLIWEKFFSFGNMNWNAPASVMGTATTTSINLQADGAAVYGAVRTALDQNKVLSCCSNLNVRNLDVPKSLYQMGHCYSIVEAYQDVAGNPYFILRNIYGIRDYSDSADVNNLLTINPAQGLFTLNLKQLQNNLYGCIAQDCQFGGTISAPVITSPLTATGTVGAAFSYTITASNSPTSFNAAGLPAGLSVNTSTGVISGTPTTAGTSNVTISATNSGGTGIATLVLTVIAANHAPVITSAATAVPNPATVGQSVSFTVAAGDADGDPLTYSWTFGDGAMGSGASAAHAYAAAGTYTATVTVSDGKGGSVSSTVTEQVNAVVVTPVITSALTASGTVGASFSYTIAASNSPTSFNATGLPAGLSVNTSTGVVSGTPTAAGVSSVTVSATNAGGTGTATLTLTINSSSGGPVLYWKLDETSGTVASDSSGNGNTGTLNGGTWATGKINGGLNLNGASQYAITTTNLSSQFAGGSVTIALWFKATAAGVIVDELGQPGINTNWHDSQIEVLSDGTVYARVWNMPAVSLGKVTFGQWTHVALRYDNAAQKLDGFLNGVQSAASVSGSKQWPGSLYYALGANDGTNLGSGGYFNGALDDFRVYNRALSAAEVAALMGSGATASATYVKTDTSTQGNWKGVYGIDGSAIQADSTNYPAYASVAFINNALYTWTSSTTDVRAPLKFASTTDRIASCWYSGNGVGTTFSIDLNLTDGAVHRVALYCLDWDSTTRAQTFEIDNASTGAILDGPRPLANYNGGDYVVWDIKGHVTIKLVCTGGWNAVVSGIFFGASNAIAPSITTQPVNQTVIAGQTATFSVAATGTAPLSYQWQKNGVNISGATSATYTTPATTTADSGSTFRCIVSNSAGSVTSASATLTVNSSADPTLVGYWKFDDGAGSTAIDSSGHGNTGTLQGGTTWTTSGKVGGAVNFDGASGGMNVANVNALPAGNTAHTVAAWVKVNALPSNRAWILLLGNEGSGSHHWLINSSGATQFGVWNGNQVSPTLSVGQWTHVAMTFDGTTLKGYVNGNAIGSTTAAFNLQGVPLTLAQSHISENYFNGSLDDVRIYNRALSTSEIVTLAGGSSSGADTIWVEDNLPAGGVAQSDGGDSWNWISANPAPFSGTVANQSTISAGEHQHYFSGATQTLTINTGDTMIAYVYLDPANVPSEIMLQWNNGSWEHRAYWGANNIGWGNDSTVSRHYMGALPAAGQWVRLEVPANTVGLEGSVLNGMAFTIYGGRATWDHAGKNGSTPAAANTAAVMSAQPDSAIDLGSVPVNQLFKLKLPVPAELTGSGKVRTTATGLPSGARIGSGFIGGHAKTAGTFTFTVQFQTKKITTGTSGKRTATMLQVTREYVLTVTP